jgi:hypothetical protein
MLGNASTHINAYVLRLYSPPLGSGWLEGCIHLSRLKAYLDSSPEEGSFNTQVSMDQHH